MSGSSPRPALTLTLLPESFTILKLPAEADLPAWATSGRVWQVSRALEEMTVVVDATEVPAEAAGERSEDWRCLRISEVFDFSVPGILASVLSPVADAGVGIFAASTYSTDYVWIAAVDVPTALSALTAAGHRVHQDAPVDVR